jgi:hypothetical protein
MPGVPASRSKFAERVAVGRTSFVCLTIFVIRLKLNLCRFLYTQFLAVDANFKLKGKDRGIKDLDLTPGWASFVDDGRYHEHIAQYVDQSEVCVAVLHSFD